MTARTVQILAVVVIALFAAVFALNWQRGGPPEKEELLFPGLKDRIDDVSAVTVTDADGPVTIKRDGERWVVPEKGGYAANTDALRQVLLAVADARKVEPKTSNPEMYGRLGVAEPGAEDGGTLVKSAGLEGKDFALILGDAVQQEYRYVRVADEPQSWLVDQNPDVPDDASGWLAQEIVDIDSSRISSVTVTHDDGETIHVHKDQEDATNFTVDDIPEGRELSYPSVANGIAAVLGNLTLEDVAAAPESAAPPQVTTVFSTFDGLEVRVLASEQDEETWITLAASAREPAAADPAAPEAAATESPGADAAPRRRAGNGHGCGAGAG